MTRISGVMKRAALIVLLVAAWSIGIRSRVEPSAPVALHHPLAIAVIGDSVAHGAGDESGLGIAGRLVSAGRVLNLGINGARTFTVEALLDRADVRDMLARVDVVVVSIGGNDLYGDLRARVWSTLSPASHQAYVARRIETVVGKLRRVNASAHIYLLGLYNPYRVAWLDTQVNLWDARLIARFANKRDVTVVRICDLLRAAPRISSRDHFHPGASGYAAIANRLLESM